MLNRTENKHEKKEQDNTQHEHPVGFVLGVSMHLRFIDNVLVFNYAAYIKSFIEMPGHLHVHRL